MNFICMLQRWKNFRKQNQVSLENESNRWLITEPPVYLIQHETLYLAEQYLIGPPVNLPGVNNERVRDRRIIIGAHASK